MAERRSQSQCLCGPATQSKPGSENSHPKEIIFPVLKPGTKSSEASSQFTFLVSTSGDGRTKDSRKRVRSHVMQNYRRNQVLERAGVSGGDQSSRSRGPEPKKRTQSESSETNDPVCVKCGLMKNAATSGTLPRQTSIPRLNRKPGEHMDLFNTLPVIITTGTYLVFNHMKQYQILVKTPQPRKGATADWIPFVIANTALLNATLVLGASHWILLGGSKTEVALAYYHHKVEAIKTINKGLADKRSAISDSILAAIAILAIAEATNGAPTAASTHLSGLERLVLLRQNTCMDDPSPLLQRLVQMARLLVPKSSPEPEGIPSAEDSANEASIPVFSSPVFRPYENSPDPTLSQNLAGLHPAMRTMFVELSYLCTLLEAMPIDAHGKELDSFNRRLRVAEQRMFRLTHCEDGTLNSPRETLWKMRSYPIAGTIFLYLYLRNIPPSSTSLDYFIGNLEDGLKEGKIIDNAELFPPDVLLWILFMGGIASEDRPQRKWFREQASKPRATLALDSWPAARQVLMRFPFTGSDCENHCRGFWSELV